MKDFKTLVVALAAVVGFNSWAASSTCTVKAVPSDGGAVWVTRSALSAPDYYASSDSSTYDYPMNIGISHTFYGYYQENGEGDFLYWSNSETGTSADYSLQTQTIFGKTYVYIECSVDKGDSKTIYAHFHKHAMTYAAEGLTITRTCSNADGHCKSFPTATATLAAESRVYDGNAFAATVTGDQSATLSYSAKAGSALTEGKAINVGDYTVTMTYGDKSVSKDFSITHVHVPVYTAAGKVIYMSCTTPGCEYQTTQPIATLEAAAATYTSAAYAGASISKGEGFLGNPEFAYYQNGAAINGAPSAAGDYVVTATIGDAVASNTFTIAKAQMGNISAAMSNLEFDYTAATIANQLGSAALGGYNLSTDDYEISGVTGAMGSGYSNVTYTVTLTGKGNFSGTKEITWTIKAPTGSFGSSAKVDGVGGIYEGTTLTLTNGVDYVYGSGVWAAGIKANYPDANTFKFFMPKHAIFMMGDEIFNGTELPKNGVSAETGKIARDYMKSVTYVTGFTAAELEKAAGEDLVKRLTACALVWEDGLYGNGSGIRATDFDIVAKTADIVLPLPADATHNLGGTLLNNVKIKLAAGAKVTTTVEQTPGKIFTDLEGYVINRTFNDGVYTYIAEEHTHVWSYSKNNGAYIATCSAEECAVKTVTVKIEGDAQKTYDGSALELSLNGKANFEEVTGTTVSDIAYSAKEGSELTNGKPINVGSYQASFMVNGVTVARDITITAADITDAETELTESFTYDFTEKVNSLGTIKVGELTLTEGDYTIVRGSQFTGVGNGKTNETYTIVIEGQGNFSGTKTLTWTIKAPETALENNAVAAGGELEGTTLWMTNGANYGWTYYTAENAPDKSGIAGFYAGIKITWPNSTRWTDLKHGFFKANGATAWTNAAEKIDGVIVDSSSITEKFNYIKSVTWWQRLTLDDLRAAEGETLTKSFSAIGLAWGKNYGIGWYGDKQGVKETDFSIITKLDGLVLYDNEEIKIWPEHTHQWTWTVGEDGSVMTAACTEAGCKYQKYPLALSIAPTTVAEKYCDAIELTATVTGADLLEEVTCANVSEVKYLTSAGETLEAAPVQPGDYTAKCTVISADMTATNSIKTALRILTGQAICNGVHVADAATYLEKKTQDAMEIYVGKDFTASKTFVVPASWKAETPSEYDMTIRQFVEAVRDGQFCDLYQWSDVLDLIAGRTTIQELFKRLKDVKEEYSLLDCGAKTLDLNGFTVTAAEGMPLIQNLGTLTLKGEGVMTNACDILLDNAGTLSIEGGTYYGSITNTGALVISGGYFTGEILNVDGTVVLTGGTYEIKPNKDWVPCGYDLVCRGGIYYVEKHVHNYTFLPLGKCLMSATCWNWFVDDPDQVIQFSNCNAHKVGVFIGTRDANIGVLPQRTYTYTGKPVEANIVGYNYWAIARIGVLKNIQELIDIAEGAIEAENNWGEMTTLEQVQKMVTLLAEVEDLDIDLTDLVWNQATVEEETGLKFSAITYTNVETGEELEGAPVEVGTYRASVIVTTPKGNEVTRSWKFAIGTDYKSDIEDWLDDADDAIRAAYENHKTNADALVLSWRDAITNDFNRFRQQVKEETDNWPTSDDVKEYFDALDQKHAIFFQNLKEKGEDIDQDIIDAHNEMVKKLREFDVKVVELGQRTKVDVMAWVERHHVAEAELIDKARNQFAQASIKLDRALIQAEDYIEVSSFRNDDGDFVITVAIEGETVKSANISEMIEVVEDFGKNEWTKVKESAALAKSVVVDETGKITIKVVEGVKSLFARVRIPADE